jgi:WD40 repeat protein/uncharacterized caspase-like protein
MRRIFLYTSCVTCLIVLPVFIAYTYAQVDSAPSLVLQRGHNTGILTLEFSNDGKRLISIDMQGEVKLWDLARRSELRTLILTSIKFNTLQLGTTEQLHFRDLTVSAVFSPDNSWVALGSLNSPITIWQLSDGKLLHTLPDSEGMIGLSLNLLGTKLAGRSEAGIITVWNVNSWSEEKRITNEKTDFNAFELFGDPRTLYSASRSVAFSKDGASLNAVNRNRKIQRWGTTSWQETSFAQDKNIIYSILDFNRFGGVIVTADFGNPLIQIWDASNGNRTNSFNCHSSGATLVRLSDDGHLLATATGNGELSVWDSFKGNVLYKTTYPIGFPMGAMTGVGFNHDARMLAVGTAYGTIDIYQNESSDSTHWRKIYTLSGLASTQYSPSFSTDGSFISAADTEGSIKTWDLSSGIQGPVSALRLPSTLGVMLPLGVYITKGDDHYLKNNFVGQVEIGQLDHGVISEKPTVISLDPQSYALTLSNDGNILVAGDTGGVLSLWDVKSNKKVKELLHPERILIATFSPDDRWLCIGSLDGSVYLYHFNAQHSLDEGQTKHKLDGFKESVANARFSPNNTYFAVGTTAGNIRLWKIEDLTYTDLPPKSELQNSVFSFTPDERQLLIASVDRKAFTWDVKSKKYDGIAFQSLSNVTSLTFDRAGKWLLITGEDGMLRILETRNWTQLVTLVTLKNSQWLAITPDGLFDGTADAMRQVSWRIGNTNEVVPLDSFFNDFYHPGLLAEIMQGDRPKPSMDVATALQLPGLRAMLSQGLARIEKRDGKSILCFSEKPTAAPQLFSDAQPLALEVNDLICDVDDTACPCHKELPGDTQIELTDTPSIVKSEISQPAYDGARSETTQSILHVQTIGVGSYDFSTSGFKSLPSSVTGAREIEKFFIKQKGSAKKQFRDISIWNGLYDAAATRDAIRARLSAIAKDVKEDDVVFLFFSGHGVVPAGQEMFYFAPMDIHGPSPQDERETGLNTAMLAEAIRNMPARRVVLIIDACQSGGAIESLGKIAEVKAKVEQRSAQIESQGQGARHEHEVGVYVIAAATPLQEAVQPKAGNGALIATLLEAFQAEGQITGETLWMRDLIKYIQRRLPELSAQIGQRHTPMIVSSGVDFPISEKKAVTQGRNRVVSIH